MRILKRIFIFLAIFLLVVAAIGLLFFPGHIHIERSTMINQKPDVVFSYVSDLSNWNSWSPWYKLDTNATFIYEGPGSGKGASVRWESEAKDVGKGIMTITEAKPDSVVLVELNFLEQGTAQGSYRMMPEGGGTKFTWGFDVDAGANPLMRIMGAFMDDMAGKDFERGLENLKSNLESLPAVVDTTGGLVR